VSDDFSHLSIHKNKKVFQHDEKIGDSINDTRGLILILLICYKVGMIYYSYLMKHLKELITFKLKHLTINSILYFYDQRS